VDAWQALVLGVVEGVTEYLPVSSTGHLILTERVLGIGASTNANAFAVVIQSGAILAVLSIYLPRVKQMIAGLLGRDPVGRRLALQIILAFLPAAIIGLAFKKTIEAHLFGLWPVVIAWFIGGVAIVLVRRLREGNRDGAGIERITYPVALAIGCFQALALAPGTSRSLVTIGGALLLGLSGAAAVEFSMLLGVVTLLAATAHEAHAAGASMVHEYGATNLALGFLAAFVSAFLAVKWLLTWLRSRGLFVFGVYRIALAAIVAALLWQGVIAAT
jgi:undecaprenyl-diphosphatase